MRDFARLYASLDSTTRTSRKVEMLRDWFAAADAEDAAWALYFLIGRRLRRIASTRELRALARECAGLSEWLFEDSYALVGDLAETIALVTDADGAARVAAMYTSADASRSAGHPASARGEGASGALPPTPPMADASLHEWVEDFLVPLRDLVPEVRAAALAAAWARLNTAERLVFNKLLTGALRVGVSQGLVVRALAAHADLPCDVITHRLMGHWQPDTAFIQRLLSPDTSDADISRPYPFFLASPISSAPAAASSPAAAASAAAAATAASAPAAASEEVAECEALARALGPVSAWYFEWKYDGVRAQLVRRAGQAFLWSRGGEEISHSFPELVDAASCLPDGVVLDGEILCWREGAPLPFSLLQRRLGRRKVGPKLRRETPVVLIAWDLLELAGADRRALPLSERRAALEALLHGSPAERIRLSPIERPGSWGAARALRAEARARGVEGWMVKRRDSAYGTGRRRGAWWKWKVEPLTLDAVLIYAQAGHGRRANLHTDYTLALRDEEGGLVPIAKAYSGLGDDELRTLDRWIRRHTLERFGPVRSVPARQVFELAFEGMSRSRRHRSGIALRFPRILRWRQDLSPEDVDTLEDARRLLRTFPGGAE